MKYYSGQEVMVGDFVEISDGIYGLVVSSMDSNEYSEDFNFNDWSYLGKGILIKSDTIGLIHKIESDIALKLIKRSN